MVVLSRRTSALRLTGSFATVCSRHLQARKRRKARDEEPLEVDTNAAAPLRREKRTVRGASGWEGLAKKKKRTSADGDASGDVKQHADDPGTEDSSCRDAKLEQDGDDSNCTENCGQASRNSRSDYASGRGRGRGREDEATDKAELCKSPGTGNQVNISRGANVSNVKTRRGSGPSRSKRVHFTEGGRLLHSHVSKAGNVFDLMATLSVRMIPLELGDYREKWKDPLPFYDYQGEFRLDKVGCKPIYPPLSISPPPPLSFPLSGLLHPSSPLHPSAPSCNPLHSSVPTLTPSPTFTISSRLPICG